MKTMALACGIGATPANTNWVGEDAAFVISDAASLTKRRSQAIWRAKDGPGAWLTHRRRPVPVETGEDGTAFEALLDDIVQIAGEST